ncbi:hypothetical protein K7X08_027300 [Anisodus acutangulus]|uniref:Uncharacterized protein n=1 Tax=Anisodus acutangulus TaxID=402998 RepID=A0A9Q1MIN1_9SOLA|nr:hypothetical protein K7X08_027300 [Anisodus acutangulus]
MVRLGFMVTPPSSAAPKEVQKIVTSAPTIAPVAITPLIPIGKVRSGANRRLELATPPAPVQEDNARDEAPPVQKEPRSIKGTLRRTNSHDKIRKYMQKWHHKQLLKKIAGNTTRDHADGGWQAVKGKSASKATVAIQEQIVETANDFVPLEDTTFQQVFQAA